MKIESVRIDNFRSFSDTEIPFNDYTCLVGPNGAGKSTVLNALNLFFRESDNIQTNLHQLDEEDYHCRNTDKPITITVTFTDLSSAAKADFKDYVRHDKLIISAVCPFDQNSNKGDVKQFGQRLSMRDFAPFFKAEGERKLVGELKSIYSDIRGKYTALPKPTTKAAMIRALREYEESRPDQCQLIQSEDQFYGFSRGANRLNKYLQWVYVPAVKDVTDEQVEARKSALGHLLARTVRTKTNFGASIRELRADVKTRYQDLLDGNQDVLNDISSSLQSRISEWASPDVRMQLRWKQDPEKSVRVEEPWAHVVAGEGEFEGELARFGHGLQRSYLLALLQELSGADQSTDPTLVFACEEPELYQHPPQARHLATVLNKLSRGNAQVIVSTHHPRFVSGESFGDVRMVRKDSENTQSSVTHIALDEIAEEISNVTNDPYINPSGIEAKLHQILQPSINEMFFTRHLILVEGLEDIAFIHSYLHLLGRLEEFHRIGCHIVATNGKSQLLQPLVIAKRMRIPTYLIFDADGDKPDKGGRRIKHEKDNKALLALVGCDQADPMPQSTRWGKGFTMWNSDLGTTVKEDFGSSVWSKFQLKADNRYGHAGGLRKNSLHIGASLAFAWNDGLRSRRLKKLCDAILSPNNRVPC